MTRYVACSCGQQHWGEHGAAGLLLTDPERTGVVLQHRSGDVHQVGTLPLHPAFADDWPSLRKVLLSEPMEG